MTRIRFEGPRAVATLVLLLLLLALAGVLGLARADIEFYQDDEPKLPDVNVQRLMRYLESKRHHQNPNPHAYPANSPSLDQLEHLARLEAERARAKQEQQALLKQHLLELARQKQRGLLLDDLPERPDVLDVLQQPNVDPLAYVHELDRQRLLPYLGLEYEPKPRIKPYSLEEEARARLLQPPMNKNPLLDYPETHYENIARPRAHQQQQQQQHEVHRPVEEAHRHRPAVPFTYTLPKLEYRDPDAPPLFAVRPNDPRYYQDDDAAPAADNDGDGSAYPPAKSHPEHHREPVKHKQEREHLHEQQQQQQQQYHQQQELQHKVTIDRVNTPKPSNNVKLAHAEEGNKLKEHEKEQPEEVAEHLPKTNLVEIGMMPEPRRRAEQDPLVVSLDYKNSNDVYFIAVVAGCSAAAMFALVLISLTWCRLQRVSKAAADVDYPAYGVTGPNKDMSPSGDQRLAQSAQMYHFQHQKQQIIAMENRVSATRDPGSVSEAESDEENEEGDYTVYECPGLAPTAEMEVKNPLFDGDPTPATPAKQAKRNGDV